MIELQSSLHCAWLNSNLVIFTLHVECQIPDRFTKHNPHMTVFCVKWLNDICEIVWVGEPSEMDGL